MNRPHFTFKEIDSESSIAELARLFNSSAENGTIHITSLNGTGIIKKIPLDFGITLRVWNFKLNHPIAFHKLAYENLNQEKFFHICYLLNTDSVEIRNGISPKLNRLPYGMNTLFFSGDAEIEFEIKEDMEFQVIDISFTHFWLVEAFSDPDNHIRSFVDGLNTTEYPTILPESLSPDEYRIVSDIHNAGTNDLKSHLYIKAEVLLLIAEFFKKISSSRKEELQTKILYYDKMIIAEKILQENLEAIFPGVDTIAKKISLSESTLKRYFKAVFNKTLYDHYLEIKMEHAKRLLLERHLTVNEVAEILHYEKVSSFIDIFKKLHGYSPGKLKRKTGL